MHDTHDADAIVIGSGMGGLATAALLSRLHGRRVLVLERHWRAGGFTHTFSRPGGWTWDVGVHYVGAEVVRPGMAGDAMRVVTGGALAWTRMPDPFERLVFPGFEFEMRAGRERLAEDLARAFPAEAGAVRAYLRDVGRAASATAVLALRGTAPRPVAAAARVLLAGRLRLARRTTREVLDARFRDERLRAVLGARWVDHGMPPGLGAFLPHAVITAHYLEGGWYPEGSAARIAEGAARVVEQAGGAVRVRAEVERILVEGGRAVGVRLRGGEELRAPVVVSDAGARATFLRLLPPEVPVPFRDRIRSAPPGMAHVSLYLGLSSSPASLGVRGENFWIHDALDQDGLWARRGEVLEGRAPHVYVSFPSMKDPAARAHTAEIVTAVDAAAFARWAASSGRRRGRSEPSRPRGRRNAPPPPERPSEAALIGEAEAEGHVREPVGPRPAAPQPREVPVTGPGSPPSSGPAGTAAAASAGSAASWGRRGEASTVERSGTGPSAPEASSSRKRRAAGRTRDSRDPTKAL
jgi:phytoene dehydrogenase-like protein